MKHPATLLLAYLLGYTLGHVRANRKRAERMRAAYVAGQNVERMMAEMRRERENGDGLEWAERAEYVGRRA